MRHKSLRQIILFLFATFLSAILMIICYCRYPIIKGAIENGHIDMKRYDPHTIIKLDGMWTFTPNALKEEAEANGGYQEVPKKWDKQVDGKALQYGTYTLKLRVWEPGPYCLKMQYISSAYRLYINHQLVKENGHLGTSIEEEKTSWASQIVPFYTDTEEVEVVLEVSNFHHNKGGIIKSILFGRQEEMSACDKLNLIKSMWFVGFLGGLVFYLIILYNVNYKRYTYLYLSAFCMCSLILILMIDEGILYLLIPNLSYEVCMKIQYLAYIGQMIAVLLFINSIYKEKEVWPSFKTVLTINLMYMLTVVLAPSKLFAFTDQIYIAFLVANCLYGLSILRPAVRYQRDCSKLFLIGIFGMFFGVGLEILNANGYLPYQIALNMSFYMIGVLFFLGCQVYILAVHIEQADRQAKQAMTMEIAFLQAQISPHFFFNVLNNIYYLMDTDGRLAKWLLIHFCNFLRVKYKFDYRKMVFYTLEEEIEFVKSYVIIENVRLNNQLALTCHVAEEVLKVPILPLTIQPLVENAIKHGFCNQKMNICIEAIEQKETIQIKVSDNGRGISPEVVKKIKDQREDEVGIGLKNINYRLGKCYGTKLEVQSTLGQGTQMTFEIEKEVKNEGCDCR